MSLAEYGFEPPSTEKSPNKDDKPQLVSDVAANSLAELDLDQALLQQYKDARLLLRLAEYDEEIPLNQKAQIMNSITMILTKIVENQTALYDAERVKVIESILIETLKGFPDISKVFLEKYKEALTNAA